MKLLDRITNIARRARIRRLETDSARRVERAVDAAGEDDADAQEIALRVQVGMPLHHPERLLAVLSEAQEQLLDDLDRALAGRWSA